MSDLQALVQSIVTDLITARFEADVKVAELAELYRENPVLRSMDVPALNITNVSVDLRVAFDEGEITPSSGVSATQKKAIADASTQLKADLSKVPSISQKLQGRQRAAFLTSLQGTARRTAENTITDSSAVRKRKLTQEVDRALAAKNIRLTSAERRVVAGKLAAFENVVATAPKAPPTVPGVIVGAKALADIPPEKVSSIKFDVDLSGIRWAEVDDGEGNPQTILTEP